MPRFAHLLPLATLVVSVLALAGCKPKCEVDEEFAGIWDDLIEDFGDKKVMGGRPLGCHAQYAGGSCPEGFICDYALWSLFTEVSIDEAEANVTQMLEGKGYSHNAEAREKSDAGPVNLQFENDDETLEVAIGGVADSAEVIIVRRNPDRP